MAVDIDAVSSISASSGTTLTVEHTCSGTDRVLIVDVAISNSAKAQDVEYNGVAMTSLGERDSNDDTAGKIEKFILINPDSGAHDIEYTRQAGGSGITMILGAVSFTGASQTLADYTGTFVSNAGTGTTPTVAVTGTASDSIIQEGTCNGSAFGTVGADQTERWQVDVNADSAAGNAGGSTEPGNGGTVTMSWSVTSDWWAIQAVEILPAGAAGASVAPDSAAHAHTADAVTLTQKHSLAPGEASHGHTADAVTLTQKHSLAPAAALHGHTADAVTLTQKHVLAPDSTLHAHTAEESALTAEGELAPADALHGHTADAVTLTQKHVLVPDSTLHAHTAGQVTFTGGDADEGRTDLWDWLRFMEREGAL
jgi:hypothetical protein